MDMKLVSERLSDVKQEILAQVKDGKASPTILHMAQVAIDYLDTTYLWCGQLAMVQKMMAEGTDKAAESAAKTGVTQVDFTRKD